ncbi:MAG TPA: cupin domain-containing protein [bacterium]
MSAPNQPVDGGASPGSAADVIRRLRLVPHPEGGWYREVHRSRATVGTPPGYPGARCALTIIHFLLEEGEFSTFHRVRSEEVWVHLDGAPLELAIVADAPDIRTIGPASGGGEPLAVVPPGCLQAARPRGGWALAACFVAPGFEFADFELLARAELLARHPAHRELIERFTRPAAGPPADGRTAGGHPANEP